jgi:hypothetical protein
MSEALFWLYLTNAVLLIDHEIDSAYWQEWNLFHLPGGIAGFLLLHLPLLLVILYGLAAVARQQPSAAWFSLLLSAGGVFAFAVHTYFLKKGRQEFNQPVSKFILWSTLLVSLCQMALTVLYLSRGAAA